MHNLFFIALLSIVASFLLTKICWFVKSRNLTNHPAQRNSHKNATPSMAGVSFVRTRIMTLNAINSLDIKLNNQF
jgi:UDP-N-acetylmuramyl pentapeptide phosphotransferase/UDP-N-acetylglucosamine-1-phosphate transferase